LIDLLTKLHAFDALPFHTHIFIEYLEEFMPWKKLLALGTGSIDEELRLRNEYLVTEKPPGKTEAGATTKLPAHS